MKKEYPLLLDRVKAAFIDGLVIIAMMYAVTEIFAFFDDVPNYAKIIAAVFIGLLYDPLLTSFYGGTIGHSFCKIGVRKDNESDNYINFPIAILRFIVKWFLGWISLLTVAGTEKRKAIHDYVGNSVVIKTTEE